MITSSSQPNAAAVLGSRSLLSIVVTTFLASVTHAFEFGATAFAAGAVVIAILFALSSHFRRTGNRLALGLYGLLNLWVIGGFGLVGGFWNHAVKVPLIAVNGGTLPPALEPLFMSPDLGSGAYEAIGILTFGASAFAAYFGYRFARTVRWRAA